MWCARTSFFMDCRIWARVEESKFISVIGLTRRYRASLRPFDREAGPLVRNGLASKRPQHVTFGGSQRERCRLVRRQMRIEALHEKQRRIVVNLPQSRYHCSGASQKECSG